jgi:hypothetical protein
VSQRIAVTKVGAGDIEEIDIKKVPRRAAFARVVAAKAERAAASRGAGVRGRIAESALAIPILETVPSIAAAVTTAATIDVDLVAVLDVIVAVIDTQAEITTGLPGGTIGVGLATTDGHIAKAALAIGIVVTGLTGDTRWTVPPSAIDIGLATVRDMVDTRINADKGVIGACQP